jgi:hypothetical protein
MKTGERFVYCSNQILITNEEAAKEDLAAFFSLPLM